PRDPKPPMRRVVAREDVLERGQHREHRQLLMDDEDSEIARRGRVPDRQRRAKKLDVGARVGTGRPGEDLGESGLPRAVLPAETPDLALLNGEIDGAQREDAGVRLAQALDAEGRDRRAGPCLRPCEPYLLHLDRVVLAQPTTRA